MIGLYVLPKFGVVRSSIFEKTELRFLPPRERAEFAKSSITQLFIARRRKSAGALCIPGGRKIVKIHVPIKSKMTDGAGNEYI